MPATSIDEAVRSLCLHLSETTEVISHGSPNFRVAGKTFAMYSVNHHGDGIIGLWLAMGPGMQEFHVASDPMHYFIPPYVGPRGWLGVHLNKGLSWMAIAQRIWEAYRWIAPARLGNSMPEVLKIKAPANTVTSERLDPFAPKHVQKILKHIKQTCLALPETSESTSFGNPAWKAGKKTFVQAWRYDGELSLGFWVGADRQGALDMDPRFSIPNYIGHNGWIGLNAESGIDKDEVGELILFSYRHFALKRMLTALPESQSSLRSGHTRR